MQARRLVPLALIALAAPLGAQTLTRVRVEAADAPALARALGDRGVDVLEASIGPRGFEAITTPTGLRAIEGAGGRLVQRTPGRPFAEIQRERIAAAPEAVPAGYPTLAEIETQMSATAAAFPAICALVDLTTTYGVPPTEEGRHLFAVRISDNVGVDEDEPAVLLVSNHHAREIVTPVIALYAIDRLASQYGVDPTLTQLVDTHEVWIAPVWNPDGYEYVFNVDNWWRKNRLDSGGGDFGVDLNRNYPFGWVSACSGSTSPGSDLYAGPSAGSESETQTMIALGKDRRFAKLYDYHSSGEEVRYGYGCLFHPWTTFLAQQASAYSAAGGYGGQIGSSCCTAGDIHWHGATFSTHAFLWETAQEFQPSYATAQAEAAKVFPGVVALLQRPTSVWGHVTDATSGAPIAAEITFPGMGLQNGERAESGGAFGRYDLVLPPGTWNLRFEAPCYGIQTVPVTVTSSSSQQLEIALAPSVSTTTYCTAKASSIPGCVPALSTGGVPSASAGSGFDVDAGPVPGGNLGLFFYTTNGAASVPVQNAFGFLCVDTGPGLFRILPATSGGGASGVCNGQYQVDFNLYVATQTQDPNLVSGAQVDLQAWYRDPPNPGAANLTGAASFVLCP